jgi:hypothetical protein
MLIINASGVGGGCFLGSAFAMGCWLVVIRIAAYGNRHSNRNYACFDLQQPLRYCSSSNFNLRSCCKSALFQQQPMATAEASVLLPAFVLRCGWLHFNSASSSNPNYKIKKPNANGIILFIKPYPTRTANS